MINLTFVECPVETEKTKTIEFDSDNSFLDADLLVISPINITRLFKTADSWDDGSFRLYSSKGSDKLFFKFKERQREILSLLRSNKVVVSFFEPVFHILAQRKGTSNYEQITNYDWLPLDQSFLSLIKGVNGDFVSLTQPNHLFAPYYSAFKNDLKFKAYFDSDSKISGEEFLVNRAKKPVGFMLNLYGGLLVFLPPPPDGTKADKLVNVLIRCVKPYITKNLKTPAPDWTKEYYVHGEDKFDAEINNIQEKIDTLSSELDEVKNNKQQLSEFKNLLFEQGTPLEEAVIKSMQLLGFKAERFKKEDMEHDIVIQSSEGIAVVEVEGKDNSQINIDKLDQLSRVVDEFFNENGSYPEGILIGNHYRLTEPSKRNSPFTDKVLTSAERKQFGLLSTYELFNCIQNVLKDPDNELLKKQIRESIIKKNNGIIEF